MMRHENTRKRHCFILEAALSPSNGTSAFVYPIAFVLVLVNTLAGMRIILLCHPLFPLVAADSFNEPLTQPLTWLFSDIKPVKGD